MTKKYKEPARVLFHSNDGFTKIILEKTIGVGLADGETGWDIPTGKIPFHLRKIGSRFIISTGGYTNDDVEIFEI